MMDRKWKIFFSITYIAALSLSLWGIYARFKNKGIPDEGVLAPSASTLFFYGLWQIMLPVSVVVVILSLRYKQPRFTLLYPTFFIADSLYHLIIIKLMYNIHPIEVASAVIDNLLFYDIYLYFIELAFVIYVLYNLYKAPSSTHTR